MKFDNHTVTSLILYTIFGQILVFGGMGPIDKPWYFLGAMTILVIVDILSSIRE